MSVRVRFAPSPTGPLHIGGVRTALFNYLFAKKHKGTFILRIEDTDQSRYVPKAQDYILETLEWLGLNVDEGPNNKGAYGPYVQSKRQEIYQKHIEVLLKNGSAYYAFDTPAELEALRQNQAHNQEPFSYNWQVRNHLKNSLALPENETKALLEAQTPYVIRFKINPDWNVVDAHDLIRGTVKFDARLLDDKILFKSDGLPTYHFANVVDDFLMQITHVIRGEEWLPSLPLHNLLYQAFGWKKPEFAHLPLILKPVGSGKLSKRDGEKLGFPVFPLEWTNEDGTITEGYREKGYFPEAVVNLLALLGWNPGNEQERFSIEELISAFSLNQIQKGGAKFNPEKAIWFQQNYMHESGATALKHNLLQKLEAQKLKAPKTIDKIVALTLPRVVFPNEGWAAASFFFTPPLQYDQKALKKITKPNTLETLSKVLAFMEHSLPFNNATQMATQTKQWIKDEGLAMGVVMMPLRIAMVGALTGPDVFEIAAVLGKTEVCKRLSSLIHELKSAL